MLGFGVDEGVMEAGILTDCSAGRIPRDLVSLNSVAVEAGVSHRKVAAGLASEEVLAYDPVSDETVGANTDVSQFYHVWKSESLS